MPKTLRITARNARFQQWQALLANRGKRQREGEFLVQGVRPITLAVQHGWQVSTLLVADGRPLSRWADGMLDAVPAARAVLAADLMRELGGKDEEAPELLAVVRRPEDRLDRIPAGPGLLALVFDRPTTPGNIGTLVRSADAFGADGVIVTGHAADPYDPKSVRASTGSLFAVPVVRVVGNEPHGLSAAWRVASDRMVRIPMTGAASSLNAAAAGTVVLYEAARQRAAAR